MRHSNRLLAVPVFLLLLLPVPALCAAPGDAAAIVEIVQAPAWRDRQGVTVPLAPGMALKNGDVLRTAAAARAYLLLAEGSRVKLGESARFAIHTHSIAPRKSFRGALDVLSGAFRFTTGKLARSRSKDVAIRVGSATIGIRGTDLWGRSDDHGDLVALLEGRVEISRAGQITELNEPMTYFDAPRGEAAEVKALDPAIFSGLARQTEILPGDGAARRYGKWRVLVATAANEESALELYDRIREAGFAARIRPRKGEIEPWHYDLLLAGFPTATEAEVVAARLTSATGLQGRVQ